MFNGLSQWNSTLSQFTSSLSLDNLQEDEKSQGPSSVGETNLDIPPEIVEPTAEKTPVEPNNSEELSSTLKSSLDGFMRISDLKSVLPSLPVKGFSEELEWKNEMKLLEESNEALRTENRTLLERIEAQDAAHRKVVAVLEGQIQASREKSSMKEDVSVQSNTVLETFLEASRRLEELNTQLLQIHARDTKLVEELRPQLSSHQFCEGSQALSTLEEELDQNLVNTASRLHREIDLLEARLRESHNLSESSIDDVVEKEAKSSCEEGTVSSKEQDSVYADTSDSIDDMFMQLPRERMQEQIVQLEMILSDSRSQVAATVAAANAAVESDLILSSEIASLREQVIVLEDAFATKRQEAEMYSSQVAKLKQMVCDLRSDEDRSMKKLKSCSEEINDLQHRLSSSEERILELDPDTITIAAVAAPIPSEEDVLMRDLEENRATIQELMTSFNEKLESAKITIQDEFLEAQYTLQMELDDANTKYMEDTTRLQAQIDAAAESSESINTRYAETVSVLDVLRVELDEARAETKKWKAHCEDITKTAAEEEKITKDKLEASEARISALTEKMRALVAKYGELKARLVSTQKAAEESATAQQSANAAGSVAVALRRERLEEQLEELRNQHSVLNEKHTDTTRALAETRMSMQRLREELSNADATQATLRKQLEEANKEIFFLQQRIDVIETERPTEIEAAEERGKMRGAEKARAEGALKTLELQSQGNDLRERLKEYQSTIANLSQSLEDSERKLSATTIELQALQAEAVNSAMSSEAVDAYKRRAQAALKKANASVSELTSERQELLDNLQSLKERLHEVENEMQCKVTLLEENCKVAQHGRDMAERRIEELEMKLIDFETAIQLAPSIVPPELCESSDVDFESNEQPTDSIPLLSPQFDEELQEIDENRSGVKFSDSHFKAISMESNDEFGVRSAEDWDMSSPRVLSPLTVDGGADVPLLFVGELQNQLADLKQQNILRGLEIGGLQTQLSIERDAKETLRRRVDELTAFLDRQQRTVGPNAATNFEYLKQCVYRYMSTGDSSEQERLSRVIATLLNFTPAEIASVASALRNKTRSTSLGTAFNWLTNN